MGKRHEEDWLRMVDGAVDYLHSEQYAEARKKQARRFADDIDREILLKMLASKPSKTP